MSTFKVGERALLLPGPVQEGYEHVSKYFGTTVTIISAPHVHSRMVSGTAYEVSAADGIRFWSCQSALQKLPPAPPREDLQLVSWSKCAWRPAGVAV